MIANILGFASFLFLVLGTYLLAKKNNCGWAFRIIGDLGWLAYGCVIGSAPLIAQEICLLMFDIYGLIKWKQEK